MRDGIHRDGRQLYPAFPYNHFAKTTDADLQALYAYLIAQEPVRAVNPETKLTFPFNLRPLMAGWNALFHKPTVFEADAAQSEMWNRGAYLIESLGHCGACHTPRNALGAEKTAKTYLAGGTAEGWEAPPLTSLSHAPIPWSEDELFAYLRTGISRFHGVAAGPMAPIVKDLAAVPDNDIRAMAVYLASFNEKAITQAKQQEQAAKLETLTSVRTVPASMGARIYEGACAVCHQVGGPVLFGSRPSLALNSSLHSAVPDNLIQVILHGIENPVSSDLGYMPAFKNSFNDEQVTELVAYLRRQFAPDKAPWTDVASAVSKIRRASPP
jgi:nicotinate dehydrogenase subunit B